MINSKRTPDNHQVSLFFVTDSQELKDGLRELLVKTEVKLINETLESESAEELNFRYGGSIYHLAKERVSKFFITTQFPIAHIGVETFQISLQEFAAYLGLFFGFPLRLRLD